MCLSLRLGRSRDAVPPMSSRAGTTWLTDLRTSLHFPLFSPANSNCALMWAGRPVGNSVPLILARYQRLACPPPTSGQFGPISPKRCLRQSGCVTPGVAFEWPRLGTVVRQWQKGQAGRPGRLRHPTPCPGVGWMVPPPPVLAWFALQTRLSSSFRPGRLLGGPALKHPHNTLLPGRLSTCRRVEPVIDCCVVPQSPGVPCTCTPPRTFTMMASVLSSFVLAVGVTIRGRIPLW